MSREKEPQDVSEQNELNPSSDYCQLYKNVGKASKLSQQERREFLLKEQKEKRHNLVDSYRDFAEAFLEDAIEDTTDGSEISEDMEVDVKIETKRRKKFLLMKSEWFSEVPEDLEENWLVKLAPEGFRVLVITKKHQTIVVNEKGKVLTLKTYLPGGGLDKGSGLTVLDCIFNKFTKSLFVLDCLYWNNMSLLDGETNFRFYWLKNKFDEHSKLSETNKPHRIYLLDFFPAQKPLIQDRIFEELTVSDHQLLYEGIVFYHKELNYTFGETPLQGWLFLYMLPEKLGIDVRQENLARKPKDYECLEKYLETWQRRKFDNKYWRERRQKEKQSMDTL